MKWVKDRLLKDDIRLCRLCGTADEDEEHVLLHCPHYARVRTKFLNLNGLCLREMFGLEDQVNVAKFVQACLAARDRMLSKL